MKGKTAIIYTQVRCLEWGAENYLPFIEKKTLVINTSASYLVNGSLLNRNEERWVGGTETVSFESN